MDQQRLYALAKAQTLGSSAKDRLRLANEFGATNARWAYEQIELRTRAKAKFTNAAEMLFVREALEQATHEAVAAYHASRFDARRLPGEVVADLTTGIGGDLIAFSKQGQTVGYELDPERADCARWNAPNSTVIEQDCLEADWSFKFAFADPARRVEGQRTLDPDQFAPNPKTLSERLACLELGGIKLSPLLPDHFLESLGPCLEFVSFAGECREALIWTGKRAEPGRFAVHIESGSRLASLPLVQTTEEPMDHLYEADPAAIRAHCLGAFAIPGLGDSNGYLTANESIESPWLTAYNVLWSGKADLKTTRSALQNLGASTPEVKQRGTKLDLPAIQKQLKCSGSRHVYLVIWPIGRSHRHTIVERRKMLV